MKSMTGYGRCHIEEDGREMTVEVKSVNHRFLDISYRLSRTLSFLDDTVRRGVSARLARGHVDVFVSYANHRQDAREVRVDTALALAYQRAVAELGGALGADNVLPLEAYTRLPDVLTVQEKEEDQQAVRALFDQALSGALDDLVAMRTQEGYLYAPAGRQEWNVLYLIAGLVVPLLIGGAVRWAGRCLHGLRKNRA